MSSRCKRSRRTNMPMQRPDISDDGCGCIASVHDFCTDDCSRISCSFSTECWQGSSFRACEDDRVTRTIALVHQGTGDILYSSGFADKIIGLRVSLDFMNKLLHLAFVKAMH